MGGIEPPRPPPGYATVYFVFEILMDNLFAGSHTCILPISRLRLYSNVWASLDDMNKRVSSVNNLTLKSEALQMSFT